MISDRVNHAETLSFFDLTELCDWWDRVASENMDLSDFRWCRGTNFIDVIVAPETVWVLMKSAAGSRLIYQYRVRLILAQFENYLFPQTDELDAS